jgi:hypothetical protein
MKKSNIAALHEATPSQLSSSSAYSSLNTLHGQNADLMRVKMSENPGRSEEFRKAMNAHYDYEDSASGNAREATSGTRQVSSFPMSVTHRIIAGQTMNDNVN